MNNDKKQNNKKKIVNDNDKKINKIMKITKTLYQSLT